MFNIIYKIPLSYYIIATLINFATSAFLGIFIYSKNRDANVNKTFAFFCLTVAQWSFFYFLWLSVKEKRFAEFYLRTCMIGVAFMPTVFTHFILYLTKGKINPIFLRLNYFTSLIVVGTIYTPLYAYDFKPFLIFPYWGRAGIFFPFHLLHFFANVLYSHYKMFKSIRKSKNIIFRKQVGYVFIGTIIGYLGGVANYLCWYRIELPPVSNILVSVYVGAVAYAIMRHHLMDIEVVIKKTLVFASLFAIAFGIFVGITVLTQELIAGGRLLGLAISTIIIIFSVRPLEDFLIRITDKYLFQKKYGYRQVLTSFIDEVITVLDLNTIIQKTLQLLDKMFHPERSAILLLDTDKNRYISYGGSGYDKNIALEPSSRIPMYLKANKNILCIEDESFAKADKGLKDEVDNLNACLAMPLMLRNNLIGIMLLGKKKSDEHYTKEDLDILTDLAQTEAISISNSRTHALLLEAKEKEQQTEHLISLGFVVTNISHELRNPIHIISGAAETTLDAIDAELNINNLNERNRKTVEYIKTKLKSIMDKSDKTHEMLESILHAVKINPENFVDLNLQKTANEAISRIEPYSKSANINIINNIPDTFPAIKADPITIEQVFVNLLTNAIHAIEYSKKGDKVEIAVIDVGDNARIEISDNGPGIPEQDIKRIFEPFYTTKDNLYVYKKGRNKGVGLGLMIVYQTIAKHNGTIHVKSKKGKGATFIIELPKTRKKQEIK